MTSAGYVKALVSIHTTSAIDSPHIDYPDVQNVKIHSTENYGETGTLQLINRYNDPTKNLLTDTCTLWSDGTSRKITHSMFVRIYANERTEDNAIGVYLMVSLMVSDDLVMVTFCDSVQYLRSIGSEYVRNHYEGAAVWHAHATRWDTTNNCGVIEHPSDVTVHGGEYGDVKFFVKTSSSVDYSSVFGRGLNAYVDVVIPDQGKEYVVIKVPSLTRTEGGGGWGSVKQKIELIIDGEVRYTATFTGMSHTITNPVVANGECTIRFTSIEMSSTRRGQRNGWKLVFGDGGSTFENETITGDYVIAYPTTNIEGQSLTTTLWKINTVDGNPITQDEYNPNWLGKAQLFYVDTESRVAADVIFDRILQAFNFTSIGSIGQRGVNMFRCNGDFLHNYILALADMPDDEGEDIGRQYAFCSSPYVWNRIIKGKRYKKSDTSFQAFNFPGDTVLDSTPFELFNPSITLKNHPRLAVAKGTGENDVPIMVALLDPNAPIGASTPSVNGSITNPVEGALAVYSTIMTNRSEDWQGEMTLTGIDMDVMTEYGYVGGIPIRITDSRYGFAAYEAKVKEAEWDFANQTTTITINNYSEMYSNAILDTAKMAYSSGDLSAEASNKDMFVRQYIMMFVGAPCETAMESMKIAIPSGTDGTATDIQKIDFPELNLRLLYAYFDVGNGVSNVQYGVTAINLDNVYYPIDEVKRPDKYSNQSLIVNMLFKLYN